MKLNTSPIPLYYQLETILRSRIASGDWPIGYRLPNESDIAQQYGLSVVTVKRSLSKLASDGLISRKRGKGTYVEDLMKNERFQPLEGSLNKAIASEVSSTTVKVFDYELIHPQPEVTNALALKNNQRVLCYKRLHHYCNSKEPFSLSVNYVKEDVGRKINPEDIAKYLLITILKKRCSIEIGYARQIMRAMVADYYLADKLTVNMGFPILKVERILYSLNEGPIAFVNNFYRGDRYVFRADLTYETNNDNMNLVTYSQCT
jgi:GntR family transcriptional regulator